MKSIIPYDQPGQCYICRRMGRTQVHHMIHGSRRKAADRYGLTVHLCPVCHRLLHDRGVNDRDLKELAQVVFEEKFDHEKFMEIFGKNYRRD